MSRRMSKMFAGGMLWAVAFLYRRMMRWQVKHRNVADYRVTEATEGLRQAQKALRHLSSNSQYPEWLEAHRKFSERLASDR